MSDRIKGGHGSRVLALPPARLDALRISWFGLDSTGTTGQPLRVAQWSAGGAGVVELPSGRRLLGRSLLRPLHEGPADLTLVLARRPPAHLEDTSAWIAWPDFGLPRERALAARLLRDAWTRSSRERVAIACRGGRGRTGTALACIAVLDGMRPSAAVSFVRRGYDARAVETPWQARYVATFSAADATA